MVAAWCVCPSCPALSWRPCSAGRPWDSRNAWTRRPRSAPSCAFISPTSRRLVYSKSPFSRDVPPPKKLHIVDLQGGEETILPIEARYKTIGEFAWSNDGLRLAYKLYNMSFEDDCQYAYSIRLLDLTDFTSITFVKDVIVEQCQQTPSEFNMQGGFDNVINLEKDGEIWQYDIVDQKLKLVATETPNP